MAIGGIKLDGDNEDFNYFAKAIQNGQIKSLILRDSPISNMNKFQLVCNALRKSAIGNLAIVNSEKYLQPHLDALIEVLPQIPSLTALDLHGQIKLNKKKLIDILDLTEIETLVLSFVRLNDQDSVQLARKIPNTKLKFLDVRFNSLNWNSINALKDAKKNKLGTTFLLSASQIGW